MNRPPLPRWPAVLVLAAALLPGLALAQSHRSGHAHQHGIARLNVVVEERRIGFALEMPLDNLVGFERAPRTADEKRRVDAAIATLKAAAELFRIDPAAGCRLAEVTLTSAALKLGAAGTEPDDGHADLDADITFECSQATKAAQVEIRLFQAFPRLQRLDVQAATPKRQFKRSLKRPDGRLSLVP